MVVAHQGEHAAVLRGAGEIGVAEDVAGAVDARALAVPHAEHAVVLALAAQLGLLRAPDGGRGEILVQAGLEEDVVPLEMRLGAHELLVEPAERRAAIARDVAGGVEPGAAVALLLHQAGADQRLIAGDEHAALGKVVFVVEGDVLQRHCAGLRWYGCAAAKDNAAAPNLVHRVGQNKSVSNAVISIRKGQFRFRHGRSQRNCRARGSVEIWRNAAKSERARGTLPEVQTASSRLLPK